MQDKDARWNCAIYYVSLCSQPTKSAVRSTSRGAEDTGCVRWDESQTIVVWEIRSLFTRKVLQHRKECKTYWAFLMVMITKEWIKANGYSLHWWKSVRCMQTLSNFFLCKRCMHLHCMYDCNYCWVILKWSVSYSSLFSWLTHRVMHT